MVLFILKGYPSGKIGKKCSKNVWALVLIWFIIITKEIFEKFEKLK